jgi:hypothetical protein
MKNLVKNTAYTVTWLAAIGLNNVNALNFGGHGEQGLGGSTNTIDQTIISFINYLVTFLSIIAVLMIIWAWFSILTAGWDEEKVKKGKTTIIQTVIGLIVIWLAYAIVFWITTALSWGAA